MPINFGTDGWRAVISDTFTFHNLRMITQAIADAVKSEGWLNGMKIEPAPDPRKMIVGFDTRFLSDRYAREAARVLAANGFKGISDTGRCANAGNFICGKKHERYWRNHDHRVA